MLRVIGFGNTIHSDDGFAAHVIEQMMPAWRDEADVELYFAGTAGLNAMALFDDCSQVLVVDIIRREFAKAPLAWYGVEEVIELDWADGQNACAHGQGLGYLYKALQAVSANPPKIRTLLCASDLPKAYSLQLSENIIQTIDEAVKELTQTIQTQKEFPIVVEDVTQGQGCWIGSAKLPNKRFASKVMIFERDQHYHVISALCPHMGFDLSDQQLNEQGQLVCPVHNMAIDVFAKCTKNQRSYYLADRNDQGFVITGFCE